VDVHPLLEDGSLRLEVDSGLRRAVARWLPLLPRDGTLAEDSALIAVRGAAGPVAPPPLGPRTLALGQVDAWVGPEHATLRGATALRGSVALAQRGALLHLPTPAGNAEADRRAGWEAYTGCTLAAALLLGRMGRALAHAAAVAPGDRGAWLLVGDSHAGKTTTCANLVAGGWHYLSDDNVVLSRDPHGRVRVEGWPRPFHLDAGWEEGRTLGHRGATDPHDRFPGRWRRSAPLAGLLFPRVEADLPTVVEPITPADALAALLRQSPWLLADRIAAPVLLALLRDAAGLPARALRLGRDSYADPPVLLAALAALAALPV
jgi:hypothetical protein